MNHSTYRQIATAYAIADAGPIHDPDGMLQLLQSCHALTTADQLQAEQDAAVDRRHQANLDAEAGQATAFGNWRGHACYLPVEGADVANPAVDERDQT